MVFGVAAGVWSGDPSSGKATLTGPAGIVSTVHIDGPLVGADEHGVLVEIPGSTADQLMRYTPGSGYPILVSSGSQISTAAGTTVPLGYHDASPLVVGDGQAVKLWLPTSRVDPAATALDGQWILLH